MSANEPADTRLLRLDPRDNVLTAIANFEAGETVWICGQAVALPQPLLLGHKVAAMPIAPGDKIIKYGVPIGSATRPIARGEHVHTHNLKSDYLPTYGHKDQKQYFEHGK